MAVTDTHVIGDYTAAVTIDGSTNYLLIQPGSSSTAYKKINRNILLGVTGQPVDISTVQTLTNKVFDNTNTITLKDTLFTLQDDADTTKQARFQLSGLTTATTRTYTLPNASSTLADIATAQTFTNKTLTAPVISGGTIDNSTITVDAIGEHTVNNGVTIDGLNIMNGALNTNNSVVTSNITDAAVTPAKLLAGTGSGWSWQTWVPTYANLTIGNGTVTAKYVQTGKMVAFVWKLTLGTTSSVGTSPTISFPVATNASYATNDPIGTGFSNTGTANAPIWIFWVSSTTFAPVVFGAGGTYVSTVANITAAIPGTWGTGNVLTVQGMYEAA